MIVISIVYRKEIRRLEAQVRHQTRAISKSPGGTQSAARTWGQLQNINVDTQNAAVSWHINFTRHPKHMESTTNVWGPQQLDMPVKFHACTSLAKVESGKDSLCHHNTAGASLNRTFLTLLVMGEDSPYSAG